MRKEWTDYDLNIVIKYELTGRDGTVYTGHTPPICETPENEDTCWFRSPTKEELDEHLDEPFKRVTRIYDHPRLPLKWKFK